MDGFEDLVIDTMKGTTYAQFAGERNPNAGITDIAMGDITRCRLFMETYLKWHGHADTNVLWLDFQPFWKKQIELKKITMITEARWWDLV